MTTPSDQAPDPKEISEGGPPSYDSEPFDPDATEFDGLPAWEPDAIDIGAPAADSGRIGYRPSNSKTGFLRPPWRPGESGNPTGEPGARALMRREARQAVERAQRRVLGHLDGLMDVAVQRAKRSDPAGTALLGKFVDKAVPQARDPVISLAEITTLRTAADAPAAIADVFRAVASGRIGLTEGERLCGLIERFCKAMESADFEHRLRALEGRGLTDITSADDLPPV